MQSTCKLARLRGGEGGSEEEEEGMPAGFDLPGAFVARSPCWFGNDTSLPSGRATRLFIDMSFVVAGGGAQGQEEDDGSEEQDEGMPPGVDFPGAFVAPSPRWFGNDGILLPASQAQPSSAPDSLHPSPTHAIFRFTPPTQGKA